MSNRIRPSSFPSAVVLVVSILLWIYSSADRAVAQEQDSAASPGTASANGELGESSETPALELSSPTPLTGKQLAASAGPSVVLLQVENVTGDPSAGTGFFINSQGWIATNHHVIANAESVTAVLESGATVPVAGLIVTDEENDIAILQATGSGHPYLTLGDSDEATPGSTVAIIGNPGGTRLFSRGDIRGTDVSEKGNKVLVTTAAVDRGSSGSPLIDMENGEVVGIITSMLTNAQGTNYAAPVNRLHELIKSVPATAQAGPYPAEAGFGSGLVFNLGISTLFFVGFVFLVRWLMVVNA